MTLMFDTQLDDAQATAVEPLAPAAFPFDAYAAHESACRARCRAFRDSGSGVLVYRRMRVAPVFSGGCRDTEASLHGQLGGLAASLAYASDVPNFLEPWYGIGLAASAFGAEYCWKGEQAPVVRPLFSSAAEAVRAPVRPVEETEIGRHTLAMIRTFLKRTEGRLPISLTDTQSPLNVAAGMVEMSRFFLDFMDDPASVRTLLDRVADVLIGFTRLQRQVIGEALVWPGHGFASCRDFRGLGVSDDMIVMVSDAMYREWAAPALVKVGRAFGGVAFHSCGDWSAKLKMIRGLDDIRMVDGAFSPETDPSPNAPDGFPEVLAHSGIVLNARIVGDPDVIGEQVRRLWRPGMRLIVTTYCRTPEEQMEAYRRIHEICV